MCMNTLVCLCKTRFYKVTKSLNPICYRELKLESGILCLWVFSKVTALTGPMNYVVGLGEILEKMKVCT